MTQRKKQMIVFTDEVKTQVATFSGKATWPTWQALFGCIMVYCIFGQFLPCFKLFFNILQDFTLHMFGAFSVRLASDCQRVFCLLKSQGQFGQAKHDCGCLKVYTGKAKLYWDVVHFCTDQGTCCF